jgi:hypothetical protein
VAERHPLTVDRRLDHHGGVAEDGVKTYKVTLVDAVGTESVVFFNEKGEMLK